MSEKFLDLLKKTTATLNEAEDFGFNEEPKTDDAPEGAESALPTENSVELTPEKRVQLVQLAIQCLFIDKSKIIGNTIVDGLAKSPIDLTNVEQKEGELSQLISSLNLPE